MAEEREIKLMEETVEKADRKFAKRLTPTTFKAIKIVENFISENKLVCYGGMAINNILPKKAQFYGRREFPDYDFFSNDALNDAKKLANWLVSTYGLEKDDPQVQRLVQKEETELTERLKPHIAKKSKYYGKEFDRKLELRKIKSFISGIQKLDKELQGFQNNGGFYGPSKILNGLADAENEAYNYQWEIEQGRWDGEIEVDS